MSNELTMREQVINALHDRKFLEFVYDSEGRYMKREDLLDLVKVLVQSINLLSQGEPYRWWDSAEAMLEGLWDIN